MVCQQPSGARRRSGRARETVTRLICVDKSRPGRRGGEFPVVTALWLEPVFKRRVLNLLGALPECA